MPIVLGDFNATPYGRHVRALQQTADLQGTWRGRPPRGTWPANLPAFGRISIDHALHDAGLVAMRYETLPSIGSDHLPILLELAPAESER